MQPTPGEAIEEILGVPIDDRPAVVEPCWEEKNVPAISSYDPDEPVTDDLRGLMQAIYERQGRIEKAINEVGSQTNWLVQAFAEARTGFMAMSEQLAKKGPLGLIKMLTNGK